MNPREKRPTDLNALRYFYEVARLKSFTRASRSLGIGQPSISRMVKQLETKEGVKLLDRTTREVALTPAGARMFETCARVFSELEVLKSTLSLEREECAGPLSLGASDNVCNYLLPGWLAEMVAAHPRVTVSLFSGTSEAILGELLASRIELGIFYTAVRNPSLTTVPLAQVPFAIIAPPRKKRWTLADLTQETYVGSRAEDYVKPYPGLAMLHSQGVRPTRFIQSNNQETQKRLVLAGLGYSIVPRWMVERELRDRELDEVQTTSPLFNRLSLVRREGRTLTRPAEVFRQLCLEKRAVPRV